MNIAQQLFKEAACFQALEKLGVFSPSSSLVPRLLDFTVPAAYFANAGWYPWRSRPESRHSFFRTIVWALGRFLEEASGSNLAQAVDLARPSPDPREARRPMSGARGLVRLLLFHDAPVDFVPRQAVYDEDQPHEVRNHYRGFGGNLKDAKCWRRWITDGHIGGLTEEIAGVIMLMNWENWWVV
jgi:hypothetical protein